MRRLEARDTFASAFLQYTLHDRLDRDGWRLLAPMTALNGIMLIGWSTALIIELLRRTGHAASQTLKTDA